VNLQFDVNLANKYSSSSQIARVLTESWVERNSYCPCCGQNSVTGFANNQPVADFYCGTCKEEFELKSKNGLLSKKIVDGAYSSMLNRIVSPNNPNFFFLTYNKATWSVYDFLIIPKQFFVPEIIERRNPLAETARRAGWIGCNIDLRKIPTLGRIFLVRNSKIARKEDVLKTWNKTVFLRHQKAEAKGWTIEVLKLIERIPSAEFTLRQVYSFENELKSKFPSNQFIKDKIRQQLQVLRDRGILEFCGRGIYRKT
jgi:type II restriction enzyme